MRTARRILIVCLTLLPTAAFADVYPLNPPPDLFIDNFTYTGPTLTGTVEGITDLGNCQSPCFAGLNFYQDINGFNVNDGDGDTYLAGTRTTFQVDAGGEVGQIFDITVDNLALWSALEGDAASSFGPVVVMDLHNFYTDDFAYQPDATADLTPAATAATPEPASMTLLFSGIAAIIARKRLASRKA
jgi:hypothetical protein